jgi:hypothetical protein
MERGNVKECELLGDRLVIQVQRNLLRLNRRDTCPLEERVALEKGSAKAVENDFRPCLFPT